MKIDRITLLYQETPLKTPFVTALRRVETVQSFIVEIFAGELVGYGASSPTAVITGDTSDSIVCAVRDYIAPRLIGKELDISLTGTVASSLMHNTSPKASVDMALYDLLAKERDIPVFRYLGGSGARTLESDVTIALGTPEKMAHDTGKAVREGWNILKIKLGSSADEDIERIKAVRIAAKPETVLRLDANQAWNAETALRVAAFCKENGIKTELIEQPLKYYENSASLREKLGLPLLADESVFDARDAERILETKQADFVNIKLMKCGGISGANDICTVAREHGAQCMLGCMLEGAVGIIAAAHLACAKREITMLDLDGVDLCSYNPCESDVVFDGKFITPKDTCKGLGIRSIGKAAEICTIR